QRLSCEQIGAAGGGGSRPRRGCGQARAAPALLPPRPALSPRQERRRPIARGSPPRGDRGLSAPAEGPCFRLIPVRCAEGEEGAVGPTLVDRSSDDGMIEKACAVSLEPG